MNMSDANPHPNRVKAHRVMRQWSQAELAKRAGVSRAAVSAIEIGRLAPSVNAALALASALRCTVEELFGGGIATPGDQAEWAWPPANFPIRYWQAQVGARILRYPVESTAAGVVAHDGVSRNEAPLKVSDRKLASDTLVMACCDPAAGFLASEYCRSSGHRLLVLPRSSQKALQLLKEGLVHVAGVHLTTATKSDGNRHAVLANVGAGFSLVTVAHWEEGIAVSPSTRVRTVRDALRARLRWIGREPGSGAGECLDELLGKRARPRRIAFDHRGVTEAVRCGWADVGVCLRLVSEEAGLGFFSVRQEAYELCFATEAAMDPRLQALVHVLRSNAYRNLLRELPGYDPKEIGQLRSVR